MPVRKVSGGFQWGGHGKVYPDRGSAVKQGQAAHANGYKSDPDWRTESKSEASYEAAHGVKEPPGKSSKQDAAKAAISNLLKAHGKK